MIWKTDSTVVVVPISQAERELVRRNAERTVATFQDRLEDGGGRSHFRGDRAGTISEDGLVGQIAALAGCKWLYGNALGHYVYRASRWAADRAPTSGDQGSDVPGSNIDFKGSLIRNPSRPLGAYHLPVRPRERRAEAIYIRVLVAPDLDAAFLVGWATDDELPADTEANGVFKGAFVLPVPLLHRCPPFSWSV